MKNFSSCWFLFSKVERVFWREDSKPFPKVPCRTSLIEGRGILLSSPIPDTIQKFAIIILLFAISSMSLKEANSMNKVEVLFVKKALNIRVKIVLMSFSYWWSSSIWGENEGIWQYWQHVSSSSCWFSDAELHQFLRRRVWTEQIVGQPPMTLMMFRFWRFGIFE